MNCKQHSNSVLVSVYLLQLMGMNYNNGWSEGMCIFNLARYCQIILQTLLPIYTPTHTYIRDFPRFENPHQHTVGSNFLILKELVFLFLKYILR